MSDALPVEVTDVAFHVDHRKPVASWRFTEKHGEIDTLFTVTLKDGHVWVEKRYESIWHTNDTLRLTPATAAQLAAALAAAVAYKETT